MIYKKLYDASVKAAVAAKRLYMKKGQEAEARHILRAMSGGYRDPEGYKNTILPYWARFGYRPKRLWFELYSSRDGITDPRFVPGDLYFSGLLPYLNNLHYWHAIHDKCYYDLWFSDVSRPTTVCRRISGVFYDRDMRPITVGEAAKLCLTQSGRLVLKPSTYTQNSEGIRFFEPAIHVGLTEMLTDAGNNYVIQEPIRQHPSLTQLNPDSVCTIRIVSLFLDGQVAIPYADMRVGGPGADAVAYGSGGYIAEILEDGRLCPRALHDCGDYEGGVWIDGVTGGLYDRDFIVPSMDRIRDEVRRIHPRLGHFRWLGWDFTIDEAGNPVMIEFTVCPGTVTSQLSVCKPIFGDFTEQILEDYFLQRRLEQERLPWLG